MAYAWSPRSAGKPPICNKGNRLAESHPGYSCSRRQHLSHPRPAFGPLIPYNNNISGTDVSCEDGFHRIFLGFKYLCHTFKLHHALTNSRLLDNSPVRCKIASEYGNPTLFMIGLFERVGLPYSICAESAIAKIL